jgi:hypothetical protein
VTEAQKALKGADYPMDGRRCRRWRRTSERTTDDDLVDGLKGLRKVDGPNTVMMELKDHLGGKLA